MQTWWRISLLLCVYGFLHDFRPSEPFVTEYLTNAQHNMTADEVSRELYPIGTYSIMTQLIVVFLITDIVRYKPIIIMSACAGVTVFSLLVWTFDKWQMKLVQVFYGTYMASEVAYYTYIYAKVDKKYYQKVTGHTRSASLCSRFLGSILAQLLVSFTSVSFRALHFITLTSQVLSLCASFILPSVRHSIYFYNADVVQHSPSRTTITTGSSSLGESTDSIYNIKFSWSRACKLFVQHLRDAYTNSIVVMWSIWWSLAMCGQLQVISYAQILWKEINNGQESSYNGGVEAAVTVLGAIGAFTAGYLNNSANKYCHMWLLNICSMLMGVFLVVSALTNIIWLAYSMYILFGVFYFFVITLANATVAQNISEDSFGLIFGINTLVALIVQSLLTMMVVDDISHLQLNIRQQYLVYGGYFVALAIFYSLTLASTFICSRRNHKKWPVQSRDPDCVPTQV